MAQLSAELRAELLKPVPDIRFVLVIVVNAVQYVFSDVGSFLPGGTGTVYPKVLSWGGGPGRGLTLRNNSLELPNFEVMLDDTDLTLTTLLEGPLRHLVRNATVQLVIASPNVASAFWANVFNGRVDSYGQPSPQVWTFQLSSFDLPLQRESVPKTKINVSDWPASTLAVRDLPAPILYGRISSANSTNDGAVTCLYVDQAGFRYLVCAGWAKAIDTVYKDGVPVAAADYAVTHPLVNGRRFTLIDFTTTQGTSVITCDAQGYESVGDGTGTLIVDPPAMLKHLLVNWIYGDYKTGAWLADATAPVDTTSFGTTFFSSRGYEASIYIAAKARGGDVANDFLRSCEMRAYWTALGQIALAVEDFTAWSYVTDFVVHEDELGGWSLSYPTANLVDEIDASYGKTNAGYTQSLIVKDIGTDEDAPESLELPYSAAFFL